MAVDYVFVLCTFESPDLPSPSVSLSSYASSPSPRLAPASLPWYLAPTPTPTFPSSASFEFEQSLFAPAGPVLPSPELVAVKVEPEDVVIKFEPEVSLILLSSL